MFAIRPSPSPALSSDPSARRFSRTDKMLIFQSQTDTRLWAKGPFNDSCSFSRLAERAPHEYIAEERNKVANTREVSFSSTKGSECCASLAHRKLDCCSCAHHSSISRIKGLRRALQVGEKHMSSFLGRCASFTSISPIIASTVVPPVIIVMTVMVLTPVVGAISIGAAVAAPASARVAAITATASFLLSLALYVMQHSRTNNAGREYRAGTKSCLSACFATLRNASAG